MKKAETEAERVYRCYRDRLVNVSQPPDPATIDAFERAVRAVALERATHEMECPFCLARVTWEKGKAWLWRQTRPDPPPIRA